MIISTLPRNVTAFDLHPSQLEDLELHCDLDRESSYEMYEPDKYPNRSATPELYDYPFVYDGNSRSMQLIGIGNPLTVDLGPSFSTLVTKPLKSVRKSRSATSLSRAFFHHTSSTHVPPVPSLPSPSRFRKPRYDELPSDWSPTPTIVNV